MFPVDNDGLPGALGDFGGYDGGDTAAIVGNIIALNPEPTLKEIDMLYSLVRNNAPVRHPDPTMWYSQPDRFSRDQLIPLICAGIKLKGQEVIDIIFQMHKAKKFLTAWNTKKNGVMETPDKLPDFTGPEIWALWIRYKKPKWARLVLWLLDLETLVGTLLWRYKQPPTNRLTRNHMLVSITANKYMSTWVSRLSYKLNNWDDLLLRWKNHCEAAREYDTSPLFYENFR